MKPGFFASTPDGRLTWTNRRFLEILGLAKTPDAPLMTTLFPDDPAAAAWLQSVDAEGSSYSGSRPLGMTRQWLELTARRTDDGVTGTLLDRTEMTETKERYDAMVDASPFGIVIIQDGIVVYSNAAQEARIPSLGRNAFELLESSMHPDDLALVTRRIKSRAQGGTPPSNYRYRAYENGGLTWQEVWSKVVEYRGRTAILAMSLDVTEGVETETQLRHAQKMEAIGRLAGGVAHDFNNLLTVIGMASKLAREGVGRGPIDPELDQIDQARERAARLTQQLLMFSRRQPRAPRTIDLNAALTSLYGMLTRLVGEHVDVALDLQAGTLETRIDPGELDQIVTNLVVNARDATEPGGHIWIRSFEDDDAVGFEVADDGVGIAEDALPRLFDPFFTTKPVGEGTGLGLSTVLAIVENVDGEIQVESDAGTGTRFRVRLPRDHAAPVAQPVPLLASTTPLSGRILVVEDEPAVRLLIVRILRQAGFEVAQSKDGEEALAYLEADPAFDLVLSDVAMPRLTGIDLRDRLAVDHPELPVLLMTGYADRDVGSDQPLLTKPFTVESLVRAVEERLASTSG